MPCSLQEMNKSFQNAAGILKLSNCSVCMWRFLLFVPGGWIREGDEFWGKAAKQSFVRSLALSALCKKWNGVLVLNHFLRSVGNRAQRILQS